MLSTKESQLGSVPVELNDAVGVPVVCTVKMPSVPTLKVALAELTIVGACNTGGASCTVKVKFCVAAGGIPFTAVNVSR